MRYVRSVVRASFAFPAIAFLKGCYRDVLRIISSSALNNVEGGRGWGWGGGGGVKMPSAQTNRFTIFISERFLWLVSLSLFMYIYYVCSKALYI